MTKALVFALLAAFGAAHAAGPVGLGKIEIGMTKVALESLQKDDGAYLDTPLSPNSNPYYVPKPGRDVLEARVVTPLSPSALKGLFTFTDGTLSSFYLTFKDDDGSLSKSTELITSKYGAAVVEDSRKEEQCIYKNGANFKIKSGAVNHKWIQERKGMEPIETVVSDIAIQVCPSDLRSGSSPIKLSGLTIGVKEPKKPTPNPF